MSKKIFIVRLPETDYKESHVKAIKEGLSELKPNYIVIVLFKGCEVEIIDT